MFKTNLVSYEKELKQIANLYNCDNENLSHFFDVRENKFYNFVEINGKIEEFFDDIPKINDEIERKRYVKRYAKISIYKALEKYFSYSQPWGALTGVRPTKLAYMQLEQTGEYEAFFKDFMRVSDEKLQIVKDVLDVQKKVFDYKTVKDEDRRDLFISIPFCPSRCAYCSFISNDVKRAYSFIPSYVDALVKEITLAKPLLKNLKSVYIGGGTPVMLSNEQLERIIKAIGNIDCEFTVEAGRPDVINADNLRFLQDMGVTRICINPQTFCQTTLDSMGRKHTVEDVFEKFALAKGKFAINMDLIAGLIGETNEQFENGIDKAISLAPENITVHTLCLKNGAKLKENNQRLTTEGVSRMVDYAYNKLRENGYKPYYLYKQQFMVDNLENVGYCKDGQECVYNVDIMEEVSSIIACGANSISKKVNFVGNKINRYATPKDLATYINKIDEIANEKLKLFE